MTTASIRLWHRLILAVTGRFRRRRVRLLLELFPNACNFEVCDLGGSKHFWQSVSSILRPRHVDVVNLESEALDAAGVSDLLDAERFRFVVYDGHRLDCEPDHYDFVLCNSVIEHVPPEGRAAFAAEIGRIAPKAFVQTPAYAFPVDPHFLLPAVHWLPRPIGRRLALVSPWRLLSRSDRATADRYFAETRLLRKAELQELFPDAEVLVERFFGLPKSYVAVIGRR